MGTTLADTIRRLATVCLRLALAAGLLTSVSDRLGLWGPPGGTNIAWGNFQWFSAYTAQLNPWAPEALIPALAWFVTVAETILGFALLLGVRTRDAALATRVLVSLFALGMTVGLGVKATLNYSVFAASAAAFGLATLEPSCWSLDAVLMNSRGRSRRTSPEVGR